MNKTELARKIQDLKELSNEEKSALLELIREHKKYGLVWEDKPEDIEERLRNELPVLIEDKKLSILPPPINSLVDSDLPNHIIIEGDNLEALTTLAYTHAGKIDVIYIDPPYNTGNKDFVYNDSYVDSEDNYRHSKWLSFMSRRLRIAKKLLSEDGLIFISIDFHELPNLILICNEIFGESNFVANVTVKGNPRGRQSSTYFAQVDDSLLVYRKSSASIMQGFAISDDTSKKRFNKIDANGNPYEEWELRKRGADSRREDSPNLWFPIYYNPTSQVISTNPINDNDIIITPKLSTGEDGRWRWSREKIERDKAALYVRMTRSGYNVFERKYPDSKSRQLAPTIWDFQNVNTELGTKLLKEILGKDVPFDYPKPIGLINLILELIPSKYVIVLDFFAGSGTTLHAVMQLNAEDGGKRQCILCTNNENGICENVTYERNKRVIEGYTKPNGEHVEGLHNNNLRYYRTDFVCRSRTTKNMRRLVKLSTDMLCIKENVYNEQTTFAGMPTYKNIYRYFKHGDKKMLVIYDERYVDEIVKMIASVETGSKIKVYVFSPSEDPWEASFEPVYDKVELCALPQAIYNAYKRILPKRKPENAPQPVGTVGTSANPDDEIGGLFATKPKGGDE